MIDLEMGTRFEVRTGNAVVAYGVVRAWTEKVIDVVPKSPRSHGRNRVTGEVGTEVIRLSIDAAAVAHSVPLGQEAAQEGDDVV